MSRISKQDRSRIVGLMILIICGIVVLIGYWGGFNQPGDMSPLKSRNVERPFLKGLQDVDGSNPETINADVVSIKMGDLFKTVTFKSYVKKPGEPIQNVESLTRNIMEDRLYLGYAQKSNIVEITLMSKKRGEESILFELPKEIDSYMKQHSEPDNSEGWKTESDFRISLFHSGEKKKYKKGVEQAIYKWQTMTWKKSKYSSTSTGTYIDIDQPFDEIEIPDDTLCYFITMTLE